MSDSNIELIVAAATTPARPPRLRSTIGTALDATSLADVLGKLPPIEEAVTSEFVLRDATRPPPRAGADVRASIGAVSAPHDVPPSDTSGAVVTRTTPLGEVTTAAKLTVTFDRPIAPVGWEGASAIELDPPLEGRWRALGTNTLVLEPSDRLPGSTQCQIKVPAGTRLPNGAAVAEEFSSEFRTGPLRLLRGYPTAQLPARTSSIVVLHFDQRVDPAAMLEHLTGDVRLATYQLERLREIDPDAAEFVSDAAPGSWLAFHIQPLKPGTVSIGIPAGAPSVEGPLTSTDEQSFELDIAGPFVVDAPPATQTPPNQNWSIRLSNDIDPTSINTEDFEVVPPPEGDLNVYAYLNNLTIGCTKAGSTQYLLRLPATLRDMHGQPLTGNREHVIQTTEAHPALHAGHQQLATLLADAPRELTVFATNLERLEVAVYEVVPADWFAYQDWSQHAPQTKTPPGTLLGERSIDVSKASRDQATAVPIDVSWALAPGALGHRVVVVSPVPDHTGQWPIHPYRVWLQSTRLGVCAWSFKQNLQVWVTELASGSPRAGCLVRLLGAGQAITSEPTGEDGAVNLLPQPYDSIALLASDRDDTCLLPTRSYVQHERRDLIAHIFSDRGMYRPGEQVRLTGWARQPNGPHANDLSIVSGVARLTVRDLMRNEIAAHAISFDDQGRFEATIDLPPQVALGHASVEISVPKLGTVQHQFQIQEFRRPEYEVAGRLDDAGPHLFGDEVVMSARAAYYSGEPLADAETHWDVSVKTTTYSPPGWPGFVFGKRVWPWFGWRNHHDAGTPPAPVDGRTDHGGEHRIAASVRNADPPTAVLLTGAARVTDVNRQTWATTVSTIVHPSGICIGARLARAFVAEGEEIGIDVVATSIDGSAVTGRQLVMVLERARRTQTRGVWETTWTEVSRKAVPSANDPTTVRLRTTAPGSHRVVVTSADDTDRVARTEVDVWVSGSRQDTVDAAQLTLIPREPIIEAPMNAEFAVSAGFSTGHGRWFLLHHELVMSGDFELQDGAATLSVPVSADLLPRVKLFVSAVGVDDDGTPAAASTSVEVPVWDHHRRLNVEVTPNATEVEPGGSVSLHVGATHADGTAAGGAFATIWVVDEAVLALSNYETPDPLGSLYPPPHLYFRSDQSHATVLRPSQRDDIDLAEGAAMAAPPVMRSASAPGGAPQGIGYGGGAAEEPQLVAVRSNFDALATFVGGVQLDERGTGTVTFDLPDNLTRYRVMVNAQHGAMTFGVGEAPLTARLPLMVRPSPPRFANFGDRFEFGVVVQNSTTARCDVDVAVRASNLEFEHGDHDGRRITLDAGERAEVRFPAATVAPGEARFDVVADTVSAADAAAGKLPVYTPATTEAVATYGTIDHGVSEHIVEAPTGAVEEFGGLEVTTSSTALQALTDAVIYLAKYPYDCAEQRASRVLAISALSDVLSAFESEQLPSPDELAQSVRADLDALANMQNSDGGWGFWRRGESWPIVSIHVVHALVQARDTGLRSRPEVLARGLAYLDQIERHLDHDRFPTEVRLTMRAYTAFVRTRAGLKDDPRAHAVVTDAEGMDNFPLAAAAWCLAVLHGTQVGDVLTRFALNRVVETESTAVFAADTDPGGLHLMLGSERRTDAVMLWALMDAVPDSDLIPKIVYGLLAHRKRGRWGSTHENAHVLLALNRYFNKYEAATPDFVARTWLGDRFAGEHSFVGRTTERHHVEVPMAMLAPQGPVPLVLQHEGEGRMYYRVGIRYALADDEIEPLDRGFVVDRRYEPLDDDADVERREDGTWLIRAGARVRIRLTMVAPARRHHVALVDPLPAGLEPLNPALAVTEKLPESSVQTGFAFGGRAGGMFPWWGWRRTWYEHQNLRDERAEAFTSTLWEGTHEYVYDARATTVGEFVVPPAKAEEMYSPEVFGRGGSDHVVVIDV